MDTFHAMASFSGPPPKSIHVNGPNKMSFDTDREFTCKASPSQPPARLLWRVVVPGNSLNLGKGSDETEFPDGSSESKVVVSPGNKRKIFIH